VSTTSSENTTRVVRVPPEESFWQHYSPHHEAPLSGVGSFALHIVICGMLLLAAYCGWLGFTSRPSRVEVDARRIGGPIPQAPLGESDGKPGRREEAVGASKPASEPQPARPEAPGLTGVAPDKAPDVPIPAPRPLVAGDVGDSLKTLEEIKSQTASRQSGTADGPRGKAAGSPHGAIDGTGKGDKPAGAPSGALASDPVPRTQRWDLNFRTLNPRDYLRQLEGLGAILIIPGGRDGSGEKVVRQLTHRPTAFLDEDTTKIAGIRWEERDPQAVAGVMRELGVPNAAEHFGAILPAEMEAKLARLERDYAGRDEHQIARTRFQVDRTGGRYDVRVVDQQPLR
jgi:hypothetical protein